MRYAYFVAFILLATALLAQSPSIKLGVIDVERVISESAAGKESFMKLKKFSDKKMEDAKKFEDVKGDANRLAKVEQSKKIMDEYIDKLRPMVKIYFDDNLLGAITVDN